MLEMIVIMLNGIFVWLMALGSYPFNQKGFEVVYSFGKKYKVVLKVVGTISILYSLLLGLELALGIQDWHIK
jgi:hypothetical protein